MNDVMKKLRKEASERMPADRPLAQQVLAERSLDSLKAVEESLAEFIKNPVDLNKTPVTPRSVENFLGVFTEVQHLTAHNCLLVAEQLENYAKDLRNRAATLNNQGSQIPQDVKAAVQYEIESRSISDRLGLARPS